MPLGSVANERLRYTLIGYTRPPDPGARALGGPPAAGAAHSHYKFVGESVDGCENLLSARAFRPKHGGHPLPHQRDTAQIAVTARGGSVGAYGWTRDIQAH